ncbi:MAG: phosphate signaling complex protein PhoU [Nitriliruptoraceae bacterium]
MRDEMQQQFDHLRSHVVAMSTQADAMLAAAMEALRSGDGDSARGVIDADAAVDQAYEQVQHGVLALVALHGPVGTDLRQATALMHVSLHLERMGDYAVNAARVVERTAGFSRDAELTERLGVMGERARGVGVDAVDAFMRADEDAARHTARLDDEVDRLDAEIFQRLVRLASVDFDRLEWATSMIRLSRHLERYADHGVDIAEQVVFVTTGSAVELSRRDGT